MILTNHLFGDDCSMEAHLIWWDDDMNSVGDHINPVVAIQRRVVDDQIPVDDEPNWVEHGQKPVVTTKFQSTTGKIRPTSDGMRTSSIISCSSGAT